MAVLELRTSQAQEVRGIESALRGLVAELDPDGVPLPEVTDLWAAFDRVERLAGAAKTLLARRVEAAATWHRAGFRSAAEQLAGLSGTSVSGARRMLETSRQVAQLSATAEAMRSGELSAAKAELIASAATVAPDSEAQPLGAAVGAPLAEVREACLRARAGVDRDKAHARIRRDRFLREYADAEGAWNLKARGVPEAGAAFRAAIDPIIDRLFKAARAEGRDEPREAYAFDALMELVRRANGAPAEPGDPEKPARTAPRFLGLIRVDHSALQRGYVAAGETCEIAGLGPIPVSVARELLGDAILKLVVTRGVDVANVTHLGRSATVAQQVALWWRSPTCTVAGCARSRRLENDHRLDWTKTHRTRLDELDPLCGHHHDLKTNNGWALAIGVGRRPIVPPTDPRHPRCRPPPDP